MKLLLSILAISFIVIFITIIRADDGQVNLKVIIAEGFYENCSLSFTAYEITRIDAKGKTDTILEIVSGSNLTDQCVYITKYLENPVSEEPEATALKKYIEIEASPQLENSLSWMKITVFYTDSDVSLAELDETTLGIWYYNTTDETWNKLNSQFSGVDTVGNFVWTNSTHFGLFGIYGNKIKPPPPSGPAYIPGGSVFGVPAQPKNVTPPEPNITPIIQPEEPEPTEEPNITIPTEPPPAPPGAISGMFAALTSPTSLTLLSLVAIAVLTTLFRINFLPKKKRTQLFKTFRRILGYDRKKEEI